VTEIPVFNASSSRWSEIVELDGRTYTLHVHWNERESAWYMDVHDAEDVVLVAGIKLVASFPLLSSYHAREWCPAGEIMIVDVEGNFDTAHTDFDGLGVRYRVMYLTADEVADLEL
jgi:hypothetical protein